MEVVKELRRYKVICEDSQHGTQLRVSKNEKCQMGEITEEGRSIY